MEIAILVFFLAIFGGALFLLALIFFVFRRYKKSRPESRNFSGGSSYVTDDSRTRNDDYAASAFVASNEVYSDNSVIQNQTSETCSPKETAHDAVDSSGYSNSNSNHDNVHHADFSSASHESGASYDSGSSFDSSSSSSSDSGSSSSDSGGSSSSSSD